jgi:hypothetical protein
MAKKEQPKFIEERIALFDRLYAERQEELKGFFPALLVLALLCFRFHSLFALITFSDKSPMLSSASKPH